MIDLIEEGNLGLMHAITKFEPDRGFRFSTYASWWIRQSVERALVQQSRLIRLPVHVVREFNQVLKGQAAAGSPARRRARDQRRGHRDRTGLRGRRRGVLAASGRTAVVADLPVDRHGGDSAESMMELLAGERAVDPLVQHLGDEAQGYLESGLAQLSPSEREVLCARFGLHGREPQTLADVAARLLLRRERVRQIQQEALVKLRRGLARQGVDRDALF